MVNQNEKQKLNHLKKKNILVFFGWLLVVILLNFLSTLVFKRFDLTSEKKYTLAETTKKLLASLDDEVYFKVYLQGDFNPAFTRLKNETKEMLDEFRAYSKNNIQYDFIKPGDGLTQEEKTNLEKQLYEKGLIPEEITTRANNKVQQNLIFPGAIVNYKGREGVWQIFKRQIGISADECINNSVEELEYSLTNTIRKLQRIKKTEVTFIQGHSELDTLEQYDFMRSLSEYYNVNRTFINGKLNALDGSDGIIITAPDSAFSDKDKFIIDQYIMKGGKVLWLLDMVNVNRDTLKLKGYSLGLTKKLNIEDMLFKYGVRVNPVIVQDLQCAQIPINVGFSKGQANFKLFPNFFSPLIMPEGNHPITRNLDLIKTEFCNTIDTIKNKGIKKTILLKTSRYTKVQPAPARISLQLLTFRPQENLYNNSYQPLACLLEGEFNSFVEFRLPNSLLGDTNFKYIDKGKNTKMIVVANGEIARNDVNNSTGQFREMGYDKYTNQFFANKTFLLNCVNYLLDDEGLLQLRTREVKLRLLDKKKVALHKTKWQFINVAVPLLLLTAFAILQFFLRRKKFTS
ncbi:MAG: gliding motility-associated ABC transporter substrate-binding protein GldG [Bacteroidetes bacterium]|nr:gliding motility-associated ABC transporter substrate-binding protein GldG [Bacteroidota bacterium]